jgi:hypothetical protein
MSPLKKSRRSKKLKVTIKYEPTPDVEARIAAAFDMLLSDLEPAESDPTGEQQTLF